MNYAYFGWWRYWGFYSSRVFPSRIRSVFLLGTSLVRNLRDPFLMRIPLDLVKRGEQAISWYMGGKQIFNSCRQFVPILQRQSRQLMKLSAYWRCHPFRNVGLLGVLQGFPWPATSGWKLSWRGIPVNLHHHRHHMRSSVYSLFFPTSNFIL